MYKEKLSLTNKSRVPFALSNHFDDTFGLTDDIMKCNNANEFCKVANKYDRYSYWQIDIDNDVKTRLSTTDVLGNTHYLIGYKEDTSELYKFTNKELKEELERRGFVVIQKIDNILCKMSIDI